MIWVILTALTAVCGATKLDANQLAPISSRTAGGNLGDLIAPLDGSKGLPSGSYANDAQGVVVDAASPGTRTSGVEPTGLGGPRASYGSKDSKVGDAAFGVSGLARIAPGFASFVQSNERQAGPTNGNALKFASGLDNFNFDTDNGISVREISADGSYNTQKDGDSRNGAGSNNQVPSRFGGANSGGSFTSSTQTQKTFISQPQGPDNSYYYDKPSKPLILPTVFSSGQYSNNQNSQFVSQSSKFGSKPSTQFGQQTSTQQFGQASTSQTSDSSLSPTEQNQGLIYQFNKPATAQLDTRQKDTAFAQATASSGKPGQVGTDSRFGTQQSSSQFGLSGSQFGQNSQSTFGSGLVSSTAKPISSSYQQTQSGPKPQTTQGSSFTSSQSTSQTSQFGKKPVTTTQFGTSDSQFGQSSQFGSYGSQFGQNYQSTYGSGSVLSTGKPIGSTYQQTQVFSKPQTTQQSSFTYTQSTGQTSQLGKKPVSTTQFGTSGSQFNQNSQFGLSGSQFGQNSQSKFGSGSVSSTAKPIGSTYQQTQVVSKTQTTQQSSFTYTQSTGQTSQLGKKPVSTAQFGTSGSQFGQNSQFGLSGSQFGKNSQFGLSGSQLGQNSQSAFGSGLVSSNAKPIGSSYQQTQSGLSESQFSQSSQSTYSSGSVSSTGKPLSSSYQQTQVVSKPQTTQQSSFTYTQSTGQTSQLGKKPVSTTQFGTSGSQFGQNSQFGSSGSQFGQNSQIGSSGFQFGQNSQSTFGSGSVLSTAKPISASYQQSQVVSKPQTIQQSSFTSSQSTSQTSQFGKKPVSTTQFGTSGSQSGQNSQFGLSGSQFGQNSQSTFGSELVSSTAKPISSSYQQTQSSPKPQTTQGSSFTSNQSTSQTSQFGKKPVTTTQFGTSDSQFGQSSQFGSYGSQFGQNYQSTYGSGSVLSTGKPIGSIYQQNQVVSKPQTTQQSSFTYTQSTGQTPQLGKKPVGTTQFGTSGSQFNQYSQFGLSGSQFGQNSQSKFGSGSVSSTAKPIGSTYQQTQVVSKPQTTEQSSFTNTQSTGQTSQLGKKPVSTAQFGTSGSQFGQNSQFGLSGSQLGQNSQSAFGSGLVSSNAKPIGSSYQQTQSGLSESQFSQSSQSTFGSGSVSSTGKPISSTYQQTQVVSKPQTTQQSSFTYTQSTGQTPQLGKKPVSTTQFGTSGSQFNQYSQFGLSGSQFGQNSQSKFGSGSVSSTAKPIGSTYQQTQVVSKPQTTQQSSFTNTQSTGQTSQLGKKPVSTAQFGTSGSQFGQNSQFGLSGSQLGQNSQSAFGSGLVSSNAKPIGSSYQQTQSGLSESQFSQSSQSTFGSGSVSSTGKPISSTYQQTQVVSKPQTTQQSSFTSSQSTSQTSQLGKKPVSTTQFGTSGSQFGQNSQFGSSGSQFGQNSQFGLSGSQFGQNSQSAFGSGLVSSTAKPISSSYQQTQVISKPQTTQQSSFTSSQSTSQISQFGKKPVSTTPTRFGTSGSQFGQNSQFGSSGSQFGQNSQSAFGSGLVSSNPKPIGSSYQQTQSGLSESQFSQSSQSTFGSGSVSSTGKPISSSYQQAQVISKPQTTQQSSFTSSQSTSQTSQFGKKPESTTQFGTSGSQFGQNSQFGLSGSQFGQNSQSTFGSGLVSSIAKPISSSYQQTQVISKPQTTQQSSVTYTQSTGQTSQLGKKPVSTAQFGTSGSRFGQNSQFGLSGSQFGQNSQSTFGSGLVSSIAKPISSSYQQTQVISKPQTTQQSSFTYTQSTGQTSQLGKKPVSTAQFGTSGSQFGQNSQLGSYGSQFGQSYQSTYGSGSVLSTGKPTTSTYPQTQVVSKPQTTQQSSFTYTQSTGPTSQLGKKPVSTAQFGTSGSQFGQNSQFGLSGSQFGQNSQSTFGSESVSSTAKPLSSSYQQTQVVSKPLTTQQSSFTYTQSTGQTSQFGKKPVSTTQFGSSGSQFNQNFQLASSGSQFGKTPVVSTQQTQFGSGSQLGQNSQSTQSSGSTSSTSQTSFGIKPVYQQAQFGSIGSQYSQGQTSQFGKKPVGTTTTGVTSQQTQFGSSGSQFGQKPVTTTVTGVTSSTGPSSFVQKPSSSGSSFYQQSQIESTGTRFGQKPQLPTQGSSYSSNTGSTDQIVQTLQYGVAGSSQNSGSSVQQTQSAGSTGSQIDQTIQTTQFGIKPVASLQSTQGSTQFGTTPSGFGESSQTIVPISTISQNIEPIVSQKPSQIQFGSSTAHFGQKPQAQVSAFASSSSSNVAPFSTTQTGQVSKYETSQFGYQNKGVVSSTQKPLGSSLSQTSSDFEVGQSFGGQSTQGTAQTASVTGFNKPQSVVDQKVQQSQTNFNTAVSTSQTPISSEPLKPLGLSSTQATFLQSSSSQFGAPSVKPTVFSGPIIQTSYNQFSGKGSNVQGQSSAVATSQFGVLPTPSTEISSFSGRPEYSIIPSQGFDYNPGAFSSFPSTPSRLGLNVDITKVSGQAPAVPVPGYELAFNQGSSSFAGVGEEFGGPRDPPRFDDKTGYYY